MRRARVLIPMMAATAATMACMAAHAPLTSSRFARGCPTEDFLVARQSWWCQKITTQTCPVHVSADHPEYAAWVDWTAQPPAIFWNERVLVDRPCWVTDSRMAHEACHLKHGLQPDWSVAKTERFANLCAIEHTRAPS